MMYVGAAVELRCTTHNLRAQTPDRVTRRHPILPALPFVQSGHEIPITEQDLRSMADLMKSGLLGERRMVTLAHPEKTSEAPAVGWLVTKSAEVAPYKDTKALYCEVEWLAEMAAQIKAGSYGYLSPVFTMQYIDQTGNERGPALLFAGVTNDPHWTSQPDLLEAFTKTSLDQSAEAPKQPAGMAEPPQEAEQMANEQNQEVVKLAGQLAERDKALAEMTAKADANGKQLEQLTVTHNATKAELENMQKQLAEAQAREAKTRGDALIAKFQSAGVLQVKHLETAEKKATPLAAMAYTDPEKFEAIVSTFDKPAAPPAQPVGHGSTDNGEPSEDAIMKLARKYHDEHPNMQFIDAMIAVKRDLKKE